MPEDLDIDGALALLVAIAQRWALDARRNPAELPALATWLDLTPGELARRMDGRPALRRADGVHYQPCRGCGAALPRPDAGRRGRKQLYCSDACRQRAAKKARCNSG